MTGINKCSDHQTKTDTQKEEKQSQHQMLIVLTVYPGMEHSTRTWIHPGSLDNLSEQSTKDSDRTCYLYVINETHSEDHLYAIHSTKTVKDKNAQNN